MSERTAPVQMPHSGRVPHGIRMRIPWRIHVKAWEVYGKHYNQSAERLAERGGFGLIELIYLLAGENPYGIKGDEQMFTNFFNEWPDEEKARKAREGGY